MSKQAKYICDACGKEIGAFWQIRAALRFDDASVTVVSADCDTTQVPLYDKDFCSAGCFDDYIVKTIKYKTKEI